jgi:hypothetical protein
MPVADSPLVAQPVFSSSRMDEASESLAAQDLRDRAESASPAHLSCAPLRWSHRIAVAVFGIRLLMARIVLGPLGRLALESVRTLGAIGVPTTNRRIHRPATIEGG